MAAIFNGRYTAHIEGSFVVFLVGMRINRLRDIRRWWPIAQAMPPMLQTLQAHPDKGFLGGENFIFWPGSALLQYWRSFDDLERFARNPGDLHLAAWQRFNQSIGADGTVGVWHETYLVEAGQYECLYGNMPRFGLAGAADHVPAIGARQTARLRLGRHKQAAIELSRV